MKKELFQTAGQEKAKRSPLDSDNNNSLILDMPKSLVTKLLIFTFGIQFQQMKRIAFLLLLSPLFLNAQLVRSNLSQLDFGNVSVGERDTLQLTFSNDHHNAVMVNNVKFYSIYEEMPFSASESSFSIPANGTYSIDVYFTPIQNIYHNSTLVVEHGFNTGFAAVDLVGQGQFPLSYYDTTENLSEEDLKKALKWRLGQGYVQLSYSGARNEMFDDFDNEKNNGQGAASNTIECVYTGTKKVGYTSRSNAQTTSPQFNTEHTFPQGFFSSVLPERSDIHHLFPTTNTSNSQRGNKPFGKITGTASYNVGGSKGNSTTFEPRNDQKGTTARAMMYFVLRYKDYSNHFSSQETILREWHNDYLPDSVEERRNRDIFGVQKNRNPFVDYPQLEKRITKFVANSTAPDNFELDTLQGTINFGDVPFLARDTFDYILVNSGNKTIDLSNFILSDTAQLSFLANSGLDTSVKAGEALSISIVFKPNAVGSIQEDLSITTNVPGVLGSLNIPIKGDGLLVSIKESKLAKELEVYPNPLQEQLTIRLAESALFQLRMLDAMGREVDLQFLENQNNGVVLSTSQLSQGMYFLEVSRGDEKIVKKLIK